MLFYAAKVLGFFAQISNLCVAVGLHGLVMQRGRLAPCGQRLVALTLALFALFGLSPLANLMILPLEQRFPVSDLAAAPPTGFVILGGALETRISAARGEASLNEAAERLTIVAELARRFPRARIVFAGGVADLLQPRSDVTEAVVARRLLESFGIPAERIAYEDQSRDTFENAVFTRNLVKPQPGETWVLVTSAHHMPRAIASFRAAGFPVTAYPVDFRTAGWSDALVPFHSASEGLRRADVALREWIGLVAYRLEGRTASVFPGPDEQD
jgi:uncharacterized SAM-binding protein YcdF (DUF218 family)